MGPRKGLNFGHKIVHEIETFFLKRGKEILHGEAVGVGMICEAHISLWQKLLSIEGFYKVLLSVNSVNHNLPVFHKNAIPSLLRLILQDKKNTAGKNRFT